MRVPNHLKNDDMYLKRLRSHIFHDVLSPFLKGAASANFHFSPCTQIFMDLDNQNKNARDQLNRVLSFSPRVDANLSVIFAMDTRILAILATNAPAVNALTPLMAIAGSMTVLLLAVSIAFRYRGAFPHLSGGQPSVYFREIAGRTEHSFVEAFQKQTGQQRVNDVLGQVWRNSEIFKKKFDALKRSRLDRTSSEHCRKTKCYQRRVCNLISRKRFSTR